MKKILFILLLIKNIYSSELINVNLKDLNLMQLIKITSEKLDLNILVSQKIEGKVNFISNKAIKKSNLLNILEYSLEDNGYKLVKENSIFRIIKKEENKASFNSFTDTSKTTIINKTSKIRDKKIKISTQIIPLVNVEVKSLELILKNIISKREYINKTPSISFDERSNSIIIDGSEEEVSNLIEIIKKLDVPKSQVYVKTKIIEIDDNLVEDIGIKFGVLGGRIYSGNLYTFASNLNDGNAIAVDTGGIGLKIPNVNASLALGASLNLLNRTYALDIISEPSILCLNNNESSIYVGETVSIQTASTTTDGGTTKNSFQREDIGLTLKVKPRISSKNRVLLEINTILEGIKNINTSSLNPDTSKKEIKTKAIVNNGESVIIGGLIENRNEKSIHKIPFAGDIPLIGELFKNRLYDSMSRNLVVIVTPYIVPKDKDLTYIRKELSNLKSLEDKLLEKVLIELKRKKTNKSLTKKSSDDILTIRKKHEEKVKEYFGI